MAEAEVIDVEAVEDKATPTHRITIEVSEEGVSYQTDVPSAQMVFYLEVVKDLVIKDITREPED